MYWTLFLTFVKIGMFTIGGGYAMLPLIQRDVVDRGWMTKEDFIDVFSVAQSLPGIFAVNIAIFVGYKLKKTWGGFVCALGTILPSFVIMLLIALFFTQVKDNVWVEKAFMGLRPAVVALTRRALSDNRTLYQVELRANDHTCRGGIADLDGWGVSRLDYLGGYSRRFGVWFK